MAMKVVKRAYGVPRTLRSKVDRTKARTPQGALLELTRLTQEKVRLRAEVTRWEQRLVEIRKRLQEIDAMETFLYRFVEPTETNLAAGPTRSRPQPDGQESIAPDVYEVTLQY